MCRTPYLLFSFDSRTYVQYYNESDVDGNWTIKTGIFRGLINYNATEYNDTAFEAIFFDKQHWKMERDCSVI